MYMSLRYKEMFEPNYTDLINYEKLGGRVGLVAFKDGRTVMRFKDTSSLEFEGTGSDMVVTRITTPDSDTLADRFGALIIGASNPTEVLEVIDREIIRDGGAIYHDDRPEYGRYIGVLFSDATEVILEVVQDPHEPATIKLSKINNWQSKYVYDV